MNNPASDIEVVEVFVQEAEEVFEKIDKLLPVWGRQPTDRDALTEIRRGFHTLKGSGRMVNALDMAEVAWKVENMLNRVIAGSVRVIPAMIELVSTARNLMPGMLDAFKNNRPIESEREVELLTAQADALATGSAPTATQPAVVPTPAGGNEMTVFRLAEVDRRLRRFQQRSDEALHRSEMALQHTRRIAAHIQARDEEARDRVNRTEFNRVIERVNLLAGELLDLRRETKLSSREQPLRSRDINRIIDRRVSERVAPIERRRNELERQLAESRAVATASRALAWWSLILSALIGGGMVALLLASGLTIG